MPKLNIVVLDYSTTQVHILSNQSVKEPMPKQDVDDVVVEFLCEKGFHLSNCSYMFSPKAIEVINK